MASTTALATRALGLYPMHRGVRRWSLAVATASTTLLLLAGCASDAPAPAQSQTASAERAPAPAAARGAQTGILLDGNVGEWPKANVAWADPHHLYLRFSVSGDDYTLQTARQTTAILLDVDANASTGFQPEPTGELSGLGVDLEVEFSPLRDDGRTGVGVAVFVVDASGNRTRSDAYGWDFSFAPTFASEWYEARISRTPAAEDASSLPRAGLLSTGTVRGAFVTYARGGEAIDMASEPFEVAVSQASTTGPRLADVGLPSKPQGAVRVLSYNVLMASPVEKPEPFARIIGAIQPDVVLVQEWNNTSNLDLEEWFNTHAPRAGGWNAVVIPGAVRDNGAVGVVSTLPLTLAISDLQIPADPSMGTEDGPRRVRFIAGVVETPQGPLVAGSMHLKARGGKGSPEDRRRMAEARTIRAAVRDVMSAGNPGAMVVLGGDVNLVGSRDPLTVLEGADVTDASSLGALGPMATVQAQVLGDRIFATWGEAGNAFSPGRLDFLLHCTRTTRASNAFVLDSARLAPAALTRMGLNAGDVAQASDHKPVVVDVLPVRGR